MQWRSGGDHFDSGRVDVGHVVFYVVGDGHALGVAAHFGVFQFHRLRHEFRVVVAQYRIACEKTNESDKESVSFCFVFKRIFPDDYWWVKRMKSDTNRTDSGKVPLKCVNPRGC